MPFKIRLACFGPGKNAVGSGSSKAANRNTLFAGVIYSLLPFILCALIWFFLIRQLKMAAKGLSFGKSKARRSARKRTGRLSRTWPALRRPRKKFRNWSISQRPEKVSELAGRIPKHFDVGAPRHRQTCSPNHQPARPDAAFFSISGSDFVKCSSASGQPLRDMFEQARRNTNLA